MSEKVLIGDWLTRNWHDRPKKPQSKGQTRSRSLALFRAKHRNLLGCIAAGICGGILMALFEIAASLSHLQDPFNSFILLDNLFQGLLSDTLGRTSAVAIGLLIHMSISAIFGGIFSILLKIYSDVESILDSLFGGLAFGIFIWAFTSTGFIMRWSSSPIDDDLGFKPQEWLLAHLVYGGTLAIAPILARMIQGGKDRTENKEDRDEPLPRAA